jgi:hypothetical protein
MAIQKTSFRDSVGTGDEVAIFGYELLSQPDPTLEDRIPYIRHLNQGAIVLAKQRDIVIVSKPIDRTYHNWLLNIGLGTQNVITPKADTNFLIPDLVIDGAFPGLEGDIYVPRISMGREKLAADSLGVRLFGSTEELTLHLYDKGIFKQLCIEEDIPTARGETISSDRVICRKTLEQSIDQILTEAKFVMVKVPNSSAGVGMHKVTKESKEIEIDRILSLQQKRLVIEEGLNINREYSSQWAIDDLSEIYFIGICEAHVNKYGRYIASSFSEGEIKSNQRQIAEYSLRLVQKMRDLGARGNIQMDFIEVADGRILAGECNPRLTGTSFSREIFKRISGDSNRFGCYLATRGVLTGDTPTSKGLLELGEKSLYKGEDGPCFFPYDVGGIPFGGSFGALFVGNDHGEINEMVKRFQGKEVNLLYTVE